MNKPVEPPVELELVLQIRFRAEFDNPDFRAQIPKRLLSCGITGCHHLPTGYFVVKLDETAELKQSGVVNG